MTAAETFTDAPDLTPDAYVLIGVATCFSRNEGEVEEVTLLEPIPSASLETLLTGIPTSYRMAYATTLGELLVAGQLQKLSVFPVESVFCADFMERLYAAARTYKRFEQVAQKIPTQTQYTEFNYSTQRKRVLNAENQVSAADNVKQHAYTHEIL